MDKELLEKSIDSLSLIADELITKLSNFPSFLQTIPSTSLVISVLKTTLLIPNILYAKKYTNFAEQILKHNVSENDLYAMLKSYNKNKEDFSDDITFALDKCDKLAKAKIIGEVTYKLLKKEIKYDEFEHYISTINNIPYSILMEISSINKSDSLVYNQKVYGFLQANGFTTMLDKNGGMVIGNSFIHDMFHLTEEGLVFFKFLKNYFSSNK